MPFERIINQSFTWFKEHVGYPLRPFDISAIGKLGVNLTGVEIGVKEARHAYTMLSMKNTNLPIIKKLYLIDPYLKYKDYREKWVSEDKMELIKNTAMKRISIFEDRTIWIYKLSSDALNDIPDESVDFVYIDGNHGFKYVLDDIISYYPKLKNGGIIGGHDIFSNKHKGVTDAVYKFFNKKINNGLNVCIPDWWVQK